MRREGGKPSSNRKDPWPQTGQIREWHKRTAVVSTRGYGRNRWWASRRCFQFRHLNQQLRRWRHQLRWTWQPNQCPGTRQRSAGNGQCWKRPTIVRSAGPAERCSLVASTSAIVGPTETEKSIINIIHSVSDNQYYWGTNPEHYIVSLLMWIRLKNSSGQLKSDLCNFDWIETLIRLLWSLVVILEYLQRHGQLGRQSWHSTSWFWFFLGAVNGKRTCKDKLLVKLCSLVGFSRIPYKQSSLLKTHQIRLKYQ